MSSPVSAEVQLENEIFLCKAGDRVYGPRNIFHTYRNVGDTTLKMIIVYTPAGFEQSFVDQAAMLQEGRIRARSAVCYKNAMG